MSKRPLSEAGLSLVPRDVELCATVYQLRQVTREQLQTLHFGGPVGSPTALSPSVCLRRLGLLTCHGFLTARRAPVVHTGGAAPYVYSLGPEAVALVAGKLGVSTDEVRRRRALDARLAWMFFPHRQAVVDVHISFRRACAQHGYQLRWRTDEELAQERWQVQLNGQDVPIRPDGFGVVDLGEGQGKSAFFLEVQLEGEPGKFAARAQALMTYWSSGRYTADTGYRSLRVLTVTDTRQRAVNHRAAVERVGGGDLFWFSDLAAVCTDPFGPVWLVGGEREGMRELIPRL